MTKRSIFLGLCGAAFVCAFCFCNDWILRQTYLVGNNMPASIYGALIIFVLAINPLMRRWSLTAPELAVIMGLTLAGASIPGGGLVRTLIPSLVMPHHLVKTQPGWREAGVMEQVPERMLVDIRGDEDRVVNGFVQGLGEGDVHVPIDEVPWGAWVRPLLLWLPLALTLWVALVGLSLALHQQWSKHEHLPYPIAMFTDALLPASARDDGVVPIYRNRMFLVVAAVVFGIHLNNYLGVCFPDYFIPIPTRFNFLPLGKMVPLLGRGGGNVLLRPHLYLVIIGLAYFIPGDIAFSFGIGPFVWHILTGLFIGYGIDLMSPIEGWSYFSLKPQSFALFGAAVGVFTALLYTGRNYYAGVFCRSLGLRSKQEIGMGAVWGFRVFLIGFVLLVLQFSLVGIEVPLAIAHIAIMILGFVVLSRVIAETGLIYLKSYFWPCVTIWGFLGVAATSPQQLFLMMLVTTVLFIDPREALMPFMVNSLKVFETRRIRLGGASIACVAAIVIGMAVAVPVTLYIKYDMGSATGDSWSTVSVPRNAYETQVLIQRKLVSQGIAPKDIEGSFFSRLRHLSPSPICTGTAVAGFLLVLACVAARLRFTWWPLHPLLFVTWCSTPLRLMGPSYLLGWLIKTAVVRYGGSRTYNLLKPAFFGLVAGEMLGAIFPSIVGALYYFITGDQPLRFNVIPG